MPAGFRIIRDDRDKGARTLTVASATYAVGDLIEQVGGTAAWAACTSSSNHFTRKAIVTKGGTTVTSVEAIELDGSEDVVAESVNNSAAADNGDRMVLTDSNTVNNTGTDSTAQAAVFIQDGVVGAATDKQIVGRVVVGNGVDPDAS